MDASQTSKRNHNMPQQLTLDHVSPATRLLEKRRQMFEVQEALDAQKEEFKRREATFNRREELLKSKDRELQESLIKFNKFLQDNDSKRNRAEKKEKEEIRLRITKEQEIVRLQEDLKLQQEKRQKMTEELSKMMIFQTFLESVLDVADEHAEIADLISRYDTLEAAHLDLIAQSQQAEAQQEAQRTELQQLIRDKTDEILGYNNKIAELQKASEKTMEQTFQEQANAERHMSGVADRKLNLGQVIMACENIYHRCCDKSSVQRKRLHAVDADDDTATDLLIDKLNFIRDYVLDLASITKGFKPAEHVAKAPSTPSKKDQAFASPSGGGGNGGGGNGGGGGGGGCHSTSASRIQMPNLSHSVSGSMIQGSSNMRNSASYISSAE